MLSQFNVPFFALINHNQHSLDIVYKNYFDEYLYYPILEKQFNFRFLVSLRYQVSLKNNFSKVKEIETLKQNSRHIKLAENCASYLLQHIGENHTLTDLARKLGTNRNSLAIAFKSVYQCGVFAWLKQQRLDLARKHIASSAVNIQTIAYQLGFSDPANFSRVYKQEFGVSPRCARDGLDIEPDRKST